MSPEAAKAIPALARAQDALWDAREALNCDFTTSDEVYATVKRLIREVLDIRRQLERAHER